MSNDDSIQRRLTSQLDHAHKEMYQFVQDGDNQSFNYGDMYAFQAEMQDVANANWARSQYTQYKFGISKAIIDAIN